MHQKLRISWSARTARSSEQNPAIDLSSIAAIAEPKDCPLTATGSCSRSLFREPAEKDWPLELPDADRSEVIFPCSGAKTRQAMPSYARHTRATQWRT